MPAINLTGQRFQRLVALEHTIDHRGARAWICQCDCGNTSLVVTAKLINRSTKSCGCLKKIPHSLRHGHARTSGESPTYTPWYAMIKRCTYAKDKAYPRYGGKGITVCDRWKTSFDNFLADMGPKPDPKMQLDRYPNNKGNYEPGNCRWATGSQNCRNTKRNRLITAFGETKSLIEWTEDPRCQVGYGTLQSRLFKLHWDHQRAIAQPLAH
jgi:hypothetical protein